MTVTSPSSRGHVDGRTARWAGQRQRRRSEFVDAALRAIAEHGPEVPVERIAEQAGVSRPRLYKHFDGADDLRRAITARVAELLSAQLEPAWNPHGTPRQMITTAYDSYLRWVGEHQHLYQYLLRYGPHGGWNDIRTTLGEHLTSMFTGYLAALGTDTQPAQTAAFGLIGYAESATNRWLEHPDGISKHRIITQIADAAWALLDHTLRNAGITLDPDQPLTTLTNG